MSTLESNKSQKDRNAYIKKVYPPSTGFAKNSKINSLAEYNKIYKHSIENPDEFWGNIANELKWSKTWSKVKQNDAPDTKWFAGAKTNISENCLDRHLEDWHKNKAAIYWEGEPGDERVITYQTLYREVSRFANVLKKLGIKKGDKITIYMGMVPELFVALLAITRIGALHSVVFAGFSAEALKDRIKDSRSKMIITQDTVYRRGSPVFLKPAVDNAAAKCPWVEHIIVYKRDNDSTAEMLPGRDHWWHEIILSADSFCEPVPVESEHPLFILYTSGTAGKPKGIVHTTGGYMVSTYYTFQQAFDYRDSDVYWCSADIGWSTGHSYLLYGPLLNGSTIVLYEGAPNYPDPDRFWRIIDKYGVTVFFSSANLIKNFMRWGEHWVLKHNLSSLRLLGIGGEPIDPKIWLWLYKIIGKENCPIIDAWWQTETGAFMISPLPGATPLKPGSCGLPLPGVTPDIVDKNGKQLKQGEIGYLILRNSCPSMLKTNSGSKSQSKSEYWNESLGCYFTGDAARKDSDGYYWILGRVDESISVAGKRLGTSEIEVALMSHVAVSEAAVVSRTDDMKGNSIVAFVTLKPGVEGNFNLKEELRNHVMSEIGHIARPDEIRITAALPRTRNGKIIRHLLREIAQGTNITGDTTSVEDFSIIEQLRDDITDG